MDFTSFIKEPEKRVKSLVKKITHSGETDLDKDDLVELKKICRASKDDMMVSVHKEYMKCLCKEHSQVRVSTVKLIDYLFHKSHIIREKLLDDFDRFLELTLAITQRPKVKLKLPPPKKFAALLKEVTIKIMNCWHSEFGRGYEKLRYAHRFLREHRLVDFSRLQVNTHEQLIKQQELAEKQEKILTRSIENRMNELKELKPEIQELIAQIESLLDLLLQTEESVTHPNDMRIHTESFETNTQRHGIANLSQNLDIEFSPYIEVTHNQDNKDIVQNLKELKSQLIENKLTKLIAIEKTLYKRSEQFVCTLKEIVDLKNKSTNLVLKLGELKIVNEPENGMNRKESTLDNVESDSLSDDDEFEDVEPKEGLETYIPKSMRYEYGLEPINPKELEDMNKVVIIEDNFGEGPSSSHSATLIRSCNVRLESGKLCPRRDKVNCPFHGKIIPRDHKGIPLNHEDRMDEERRSKSRPEVPDWQDPQLLAEIKAATGVDLTMPHRNKSKRISPKKNLANPRTCDLTPKKRLQKKLKLLVK